MSKLVGSDLDFNSTSRILNLPDPTSAQQPATRAYVDSFAEGLAWKDSVRVAAPSNVNLAAPGASLDGITMVVGDRFLAPAQTTGSQNGIYIWNGAAVAATRALDMDAAAEVEQAIVTAEEGTSAGASFRQTAVNVTLGTTTLTFVSYGTAAPQSSTTQSGIVELADQTETDTGTDNTRAVTPQGLANYSGRKRKAVANIGDGAATTFNIDHNFATRDVQVEVYRNSGSFDTVLCDVTRPSTNRVTLTFSFVPALNAYSVVILG